MSVGYKISSRPYINIRSNLLHRLISSYSPSRLFGSPVVRGRINSYYIDVSEFINPNFRELIKWEMHELRREME